MTLKAYIAGMKLAGISRGQLETRFHAWDISSVGSVHQKDYDDSVPMGWKPPPLEEDLSHLNSPDWKKRQADGKHPKPQNKRKAKLKRAVVKDSFTTANPCTSLMKWVKEVVWEPAA